MRTQKGNPIREFYDDIQRQDFGLEMQLKQSEIRDRRLLFQVVRELKSRFGESEIGRVVELGGGNGTNLLLLKKYLNISEAISIDLFSPQARSPKIAYRTGSIEDLSEFQDDSVDLVLMLEVIEHLVDPDLVTSQVRRILRSDGVLLITTPNLSALSNRLMLLAGYLPLGMEVSTKRAFGRPVVEGKVVGHLRVYTFNALLEFIRYYGFENDSAFTVPELRKSRFGLLVGAFNAIEKISGHLGKSLCFRTVVLARKGSLHETMRPNSNQ